MTREKTSCSLNEFDVGFEMSLFSLFTKIYEVLLKEFPLRTLSYFNQAHKKRRKKREKRTGVTITLRELFNLYFAVRALHSILHTHKKRKLRKNQFQLSNELIHCCMCIPTNWTHQMKNRLVFKLLKKQEENSHYVEKKFRGKLRE